MHVHSYISLKTSILTVRFIRASVDVGMAQMKSHVIRVENGSNHGEKA